MRKSIPALATAVAAVALTGCAVQTQEAANDVAAQGYGRGCLTIVADHPYDFEGWRFDETAQALAHASGCFIRVEDATVLSQPIAPVKGLMSINDAVKAALAGSSYEVKSATDTEIVVGRR